MAYTFKHGDRPLDGYTIQRAVGRGGFGEVYYAISDGGREVALKYLRENPQIELRGVSHCINLKSPHLVSIFDVRKANDGNYVIVMEYCSGPSLRDMLIAEPDGFGAQKAAFFTREIAKGLSYLHEQGIVHRDLKPGNIFYDDGYVKIGDYGLSKFISVSRHSAQTASIGTVHYMAPEIGSGNYSRGIDIYALGVMLYEMLLGKVPFEGSTMAEVLMKHLTAQPELDSLPQPFGEVIRHALQKDPKDRYQTVDEMMTELLEVEHVQKSLAGFSPKSLEGAVRHGGAVHADSPMPSPNPAPHVGVQPPPLPYGAWPDAAAAKLPDRLAKRVDRVSRRLEKKLGKLAGKFPDQVVKQTPAIMPVNESPYHQPTTVERKRRLILGLLMTGLMAMGMGIIFGQVVNEDVGVAAGMLVVFMIGGIFLSRKAIPYFGAQQGPVWMQRLIRLGCCTPLLAIGSAPMLDSLHYGEEGLGVFIALSLVAAFWKWEKLFNRSSEGDLSFGSAIGIAFITLPLSAAIIGMSGGEPPPFMFLAAGVAGVTSLMIQASSWWQVNTAMNANFQQVPKPAYGEQVQAFEPATPSTSWPPYAKPVSQEQYQLGLDSSHRTNLNIGQHPHARWAVTRAFWGLISFLSMGGMISLFTLSLVTQANPHDLLGMLLGLFGCVAMMIFSLRKTTAIKRVGFWRESLRPLMISVALFGIGATIAAISIEWDHSAHYLDRNHNEYHSVCLHDDERAGLVVGLVFSSLMVLGLTFLTGRKPRTPEPFYQGGENDSTGGMIASDTDVSGHDEPVKEQNI